MSTASHHQVGPTDVTRLAFAHFSTTVDLRSLEVDGARRGAVARLDTRRSARRAEPGPAGPLVLDVRSGAGGTLVAVWGSPRTADQARQDALEDAVAWAGLRDDPHPLRTAVESHPLLRELLTAVGEVRLSRIPRVGEALGRAVIAQLVQHAEARRSTAQVAVRAGTATPGQLWCWPTAAQIGAVPSWTLRRCGISARGARALQAGALEDARLAAAVGRWPRLDARLRRLPGVGAWTSAETRRASGDPDAVSVGDYNIPGLVGHILAGDRDADDQAMLELLAPFAGQRGRVVCLLVTAAARRLVQAPPRRAPRAALSAHRYW